MKVKPMGMLLMMLAGWVNRHQQDVIEYLKEENKIPGEKIGTRRILLNDTQRMRLVWLAKRLGRAVLVDACGVFSPDTLLKWHRTLVARKYDGSKKRTGGRKRISEELEQLIIQIARKNKTWGSRRIKGQLKYLGHNVSHTTIDNVLKRNGYPCGPDRARQTRWSEFLRSHWKSLAAIDFFTTEVYTLTGLTRYMVLVSIHYATRKVEVVGRWGGQTGRRQRLTGVHNPGGEGRHLSGAGEGPAEAVAGAKQVSMEVKRGQFVKKFVSEQWILSCKSLGRPLVYHCASGKAWERRM